MNRVSKVAVYPENPRYLRDEQDWVLYLHLVPPNGQRLREQAQGS
jgi:hypothetical protein